MNTTREEKVLRPSFRICNPGRHRGARWFGDLKLDRSARFLLKNQRARRHDLAMADIAHPQRHEVTSSRLAIYSQIEQREISPTMGYLKPDASAQSPVGQLQTSALHYCLPNSGR